MTKTATLLLKLDDGWCDVPSLCQEFGWKPHTLRAAICTLKLGDNWHIERRRENGVTSYRVAQMQADDGQPTEAQEWHDYDRDC
jgi:hypothetical protein